MLFTDSYGEQSCTAGRSSFITGQSVYRTGLSKVGIPAAPIGMNDEARDDRGAAQGAGLRHRPVRQEPLGDLNHMLPTNHGFDEFFGNLYHLNAEEEPEMDNYPKDPRFRRDLRAARRHPFLGDRQGRHDGAAALGQGRQAEDRGHRPAHEEAHGDLRRRIRRRGQGLHQAAEQGRQAVLRVAQHHAHAPVHAHEEGEPRPGRPLAVAVPRHHDRSRQERRRKCSICSTKSASPKTRSSCTPPTTAAPQLLAGRRHDAVPQREEHQLGRRVPHSAAGALARQDRGRLGVQRHRPASRLAADLPGHGGRARRRRQAEEGLQGDRPHVQEPHRRLSTSCPT